MPVVGNSNYTMIGKTRCDAAMMAFIELIDDRSEHTIKVTEHDFNHLRFTDTTSGRTMVVTSTMRSRSQFNRTIDQLVEAGLMSSANPVQPPKTNEIQAELEMRLGDMEVSEGTAYLVGQMLGSLTVDIEREVERRLGSKTSDVDDMIRLAEAEIAETKENSKREIAELTRQRDEARARAERAEKALSSFTRAMKEAESIVS